MNPRKVWTAFFALSLTAMFIFSAWALSVYQKAQAEQIDPLLSGGAVIGYSLWKDNYCSACHALGDRGSRIGPRIDENTYPKLGDDKLTKLLIKTDRHSLFPDDAESIRKFLKWYSFQKDL